MAGNIVYYFAYGPNMNPEKMSLCQIPFSDRQCGKLIDYEFVMNHKRINGTAGANIRENEGSVVYGSLYTCTFDSIDRLDRYEGNMYSRQLVEITIMGSSKTDIVTAHTYIALGDSTDDNLVDISKEYLEHLLSGCDLLPKDYLEFLCTHKEHAISVCPGEDYFLTEGANETEE